VPALVAIALVASAACGLIAFEFVRYSDSRARIRQVESG
jgi:hypothetical protein